MLWATAWAHALRSPICPRYPAEAPSVEDRPPSYDGPSASSIARLASYPARRPAWASVTPGRVYSCRSRCACSHQRALSRTSSISASLFRAMRRSRAARRGHDVRTGDLREGRPLVAEDAGVAVLVGGDGARDPHVLEEPREDAHRVLGARVLGVRLHAVEAGLGTDTGHLELGDERRGLATEALDVRDGTLGREEREAREVLDVALVEDDEPARPVPGDECAQPVPPFAELVWVDAGGDGDGATTIVGRTGQAPVCRRRSSSSTADGCNPRVASRT